MNDLEICKAIAKLEGVEVIEHKVVYLLYKNDQGYMCVNGVTYDWYNPIENMALNCELRDKYEVHTDYINKSVSMWNRGDYSDDMLSSVSIDHKDICMAVCECILKSNGLFEK